MLTVLLGLVEGLSATINLYQLVMIRSDLLTVLLVRARALLQWAIPASEECPWYISRRTGKAYFFLQIAVFGISQVFVGVVLQRVAVLTQEDLFGVPLGGSQMSDPAYELGSKAMHNDL